MKRMALHWQILLTMVLGALLGIVLNSSSGTLKLDQPLEHPAHAMQQIGMDQPIAVPAGRFWSWDSPDRILLQIDDQVPDGEYRTRRYVVGESNLAAERLQTEGEPWPELPAQADPAAQPPRTVVPTIELLDERDPAAYALFEQFGRSRARFVGDVAKALGDLFLRMLRMVSVPLIITSLISGVTGLGQTKQVGKMFGRTVVYYLATSMLAIIVGLSLVNLIRPGVQNGAGQPAEVLNVAEEHAGKSLVVVLFEQLRNMIPENPVAAVASGDFLSIIAFSLMFGVCTIWVGGRATEVIRELFDAAFQVMMRLTIVIIELAPVGVFFLMLSATASHGAGVFGTLGWYMITVACGLLIHALVVLPAILQFVAKRNPPQFAKAMSPALLTAFSSASSNGTLPLTLTCVEERAHIPNRVGSFVLPLGATVNMDGTALYEVVAVLFIAQHSGIDLPLSEQVVVALTALLASIGAAGIPHAGLVMMVIILQAVGLPTESQGLIIAVDRVLDMMRTSVNVWSDCCGCAVVHRLESRESRV
jgi:Na+/H+-dicarboxylate symporter